MVNQRVARPAPFEQRGTAKIPPEHIGDGTKLPVKSDGVSLLAVLRFSPASDMSPDLPAGTLPVKLLS
jgi:hypothetical protein